MARPKASPPNPIPLPHLGSENLKSRFATDYIPLPANPQERNITKHHQTLRRITFPNSIDWFSVCILPKIVPCETSNSMRRTRLIFGPSVGHQPVDSFHPTSTIHNHCFPFPLAIDHGLSPQGWQTISPPSTAPSRSTSKPLRSGRFLCPLSTAKILMLDSRR